MPTATRFQGLIGFEWGVTQTKAPYSQILCQSVLLRSATNASLSCDSRFFMRSLSSLISRTACCCAFAVSVLSASKDLSQSPPRFEWFHSSKAKNKKEAAKYNTTTEYQRGSKASYRRSKSQGWMDEFFPDTRKIWKGTSKKENKKEASKYKSRTEYQGGSCASCNWSRSQGWLDEFFPKQ